MLVAGLRGVEWRGLTEEVKLKSNDLITLALLPALPKEAVCTEYENLWRCPLNFQTLDHASKPGQTLVNPQ